jgi:hypothetical protein
MRRIHLSDLMVIVERCVTDEAWMNKDEAGKGPRGRVLPDERRLFYAISALLPQLRQIRLLQRSGVRTDRFCRMLKTRQNAARDLMMTARQPPLAAVTAG